MKKRTKAFFVIILYASCVVYAQDKQSLMNSIKSDPKYLYATGTSTIDMEDALNNAKDLLTLEIEQWLKENEVKEAKGYISISKEIFSHIQTQRGKLFRVFVYVAKSDVILYFKEEEASVVAFEDPQNRQIDNASDTREKVQDVKNERALEEAIQTIVPNEHSSFTLTLSEKRMTEIKTFLELNDYVNEGRESETITDVGNYSNMPKTGLVYVFIHNRNGEIPACLKVQDAVPVNMNTGKSDVIENYKGCGAIWIKIK